MAAPQILWFALPVLFVVARLLVNAFSVLVWKPFRIQRTLRAQGITGPPYKILVGNLRDIAALTKAARAAPLPHVTHNIIPRVMPQHITWSSRYGIPFVYWLGYKPTVTLTDPELCRDILVNKLGQYPKPAFRSEFQDLFAKGLVTLEGEKWAQHRRIVSPAFFVEKLKAMVPTVAHLAKEMVVRWNSGLEGGASKEMDVAEEFKTLTADIIAHTAFGSSFTEGKQVFELQYEQLRLFTKLSTAVQVPGVSFLPTSSNRYRWRLANQITATLEKIIRKRLDGGGKDKYGNDLLGLMLSAYREELQGSQKNLKMSYKEIIDECKTFFIAGHETTSSLLTWTVMLLALHSEWQERAREEVRNVFGWGQLDAELLSSLKTVGMISNESLRLYPPAAFAFREASKDVNLGGMLIPKGTILLVPIMPMHVDPDLWGSDALNFNPYRFAGSITNACKHPSAFLPFGNGPRICVGQNFALMEAKIVLCMILRQFRFRLSPGYKHAPTVLVTLQPEHGMQIILESVNA